MKKVVLFLMIGFLSFSTQAFGITINTTNDANTLINEMLGTGITVSNVVYSGGASASGTFSDGLSSGIGMDTGVILTSGAASDAVGPNSSDSTSVNTGTGGDADLSALAGYSTFNSTVLEFDFTIDGGSGGDLFFNFVFASEEYNEYTNTQFNDVFAFFLDGTNIALIPGTSTEVAINTVNGGNPLGVGASNPEYFNNNDLNDGGPLYDIEYDGFTDVFLAQATGLDNSTHHIKLAIADASDAVLDSAIFIEGGTFSNKPPVPEPSTFFLFGLGILGIARVSRKKK